MKGDIAISHHFRLEFPVGMAAFWNPRPLVVIFVLSVHFHCNPKGLFRPNCSDFYVNIWMFPKMGVPPWKSLEIPIYTHIQIAMYKAAWPGIIR